MNFDDPASKRFLVALKDAKCEATLLKYGVMLTGSEADAEDLLSETLCCVCDVEGGMPWDETRGSASTHARFVMKQLARKSWRSARKRREILTDTEDIGELYEDPARAADDAIGESEQVAEDRRRGELLRQRLNPLTRKVFDYKCEGVDAPSELARLCGCSVKDVYVATQLIAHHAAAVVADETKKKRKEKEKRGGVWYLPNRPARAKDEGVTERDAREETEG